MLTVSDLEPIISILYTIDTSLQQVVTIQLFLLACLSGLIVIFVLYRFFKLFY